LPTTSAQLGGKKSVSRIKGLVKTAVLMKAVQVAQRELSKPENQRKIKEGVDKLRTKVTKPKS
jgi:hypothetical protein